MNDNERRITRRKLGTAMAVAPALMFPSGESVGEEPLTTTSQVRERLPVVASTEGVWDGVFRRLDPAGRITAEFNSRIIKRFLPDEFWPRIYHQTNIYDMPDGERRVIDTRGEYRDGKIHFESERVAGWQMDDPSDPYDRTVFLFMVYKADPDEYVYEMINISDDRKYRTRMTQFLKNGRTTRRTLIDEELVSRDWSGY
jgi:hypothetical protein